MSASKTLAPNRYPLNSENYFHGYVHGYTIRGSWRYLEHDWVAKAGTFIDEPPGDAHTLVVDEDSPEVIADFNIVGARVYLDDEGNQIGLDDAFSVLKHWRADYLQQGWDRQELERLIR